MCIGHSQKEKVTTQLYIVNVYTLVARRAPCEFQSLAMVVQREPTRFLLKQDTKVAETGKNCYDEMHHNANCYIKRPHEILQGTHRNTNLWNLALGNSGQRRRYIRSYRRWLRWVSLFLVPLFSVCVCVCVCACLCTEP